jgi:hypothetical protein
MQNHPRLFVMLLLLYWKKLSPHVPKVWVWGLHQGPRSILELFWAWNLTKKLFELVNTCFVHQLNQYM